MDMFKESPIGDRNIIDICTEDKYVFKLVVRFVAYVTKLSKSQTTTFMAACYGLALNTRLFRRAMHLRRNRLVFRASYGQPQFSTMTER